MIDLSKVSLTDWTSPFPAANVADGSLGRVVPMVQLYRVAREGPRVAALVAGLTRDGAWI
jgi:hypothetical protein